MRKLKLEMLTVESFETTPSRPAPRGTVDAHVSLTDYLPTYDPQVCPDPSVGCPEPSYESSWCTEDTCEPG